MSKNAGHEDLAAEFAAVAGALSATGEMRGEQTVILARIVKGLSLENWQETARCCQLRQWHAFPMADDGDYSSMDNGPGEDGGLVVSPFREVHGALVPAMFNRLLRRELLRINRNGGCLSVLATTLVDKHRLITALGERTVRRLEMLLGLALLSMLEDCDSMGILRPGQFLCSLPGVGQLAARNFAEKLQTAFSDAARPFFPTGGISAGQSAECSVGIVNVLQADRVNADDLLKRVKASLEIAVSRNEGHIYQESTLAPMENTTLVQSSEKRFLFFGGDPS